MTLLAALTLAALTITLSAFTTWALTRNTNDYIRGFWHGYTHAHLELDDQAREE